MSIVPANLPGIFWLTDDGVAATPESVRLYRVSDSQEVALELTSLGAGLHEIKILDPLAPEQAHALVLGSVCRGTGLADDTAAVFELMTAAASPLPADALGELVASELMHGPLELATVNGSCAESVESAYVDVTLELGPAVAPWRDVLVFETWVDGQLWSPSDVLSLPPPPGESWLGRGVDRVYATCAPGDVIEPGLSEGSHYVVLRARIPASDVVLASPPVEVQLDCSGGGTSSTGGESSTGGTSISGDTSEGGVTGTSDATGPEGTTTGPSTTTVTGDASAGGTSGPANEVGCVCHTRGDASPFGLALAALLLLLRLRPRPRRGPSVG